MHARLWHNKELTVAGEEARLPRGHGQGGHCGPRTRPGCTWPLQAARFSNTLALCATSSTRSPLPTGKCRLVLQIQTVSGPLSDPIDGLTLPRLIYVPVFLTERRLLGARLLFGLVPRGALETHHRGDTRGSCRVDDQDEGLQCTCSVCSP